MIKKILFDLVFIQFRFYESELNRSWSGVGVAVTNVGVGVGAEFWKNRRSWSGVGVGFLKKGWSWSGVGVAYSRSCPSLPGRRLRTPYTVANDRKRSRYDRIRPYFGVIHVIVLRSYISVTVYDRIRSYMEENGWKRRPYMVSVYGASKRPFFSPYIAVFLRIRHGDTRS